MPGKLLLCPKCAGVRHSHERYGAHLEQCDECAAPPPPRPLPPQDYGPTWGSHRGHRHRKGGFGRLVLPRLR